jgi:ribosomal protein L11 methyltransferase
MYEGGDTNAPATGVGPGDVLHVYYVTGRLTDSDSPGGEGFIGNWVEADTTFLFYKQPARDRVARYIDARPHLELVDEYHLPFSAWHGELPTSFTAGRLAIIPDWENQPTGPATAGTIPIRLHPGVVFGAGWHPTTYSCLTALDRLCHNHTYPLALDLGTGTGILAVAAARLGCRRVLAADQNPLAVETARENVRRNDLARRVRVIRGDAAAVSKTPADLVIANIHFEVMEQIVTAETFPRSKAFVLSGLLRTQAMHISDIIRKKGITARAVQDPDGIWYTFWGRSTPAAAQPMEPTHTGETTVTKG